MKLGLLSQFTHKYPQVILRAIYARSGGANEYFAQKTVYDVIISKFKGLGQLPGATPLTIIVLQTIKNCIHVHNVPTCYSTALFTTVA